MAQQRTATFQEILRAVKARLVACGFASNQIAFLAQNQTPQMIGDIAIYLRPRGLRAEREQFRGGGRYAKVVVRILEVIVQVENASDESGNDEAYLTSDTRSTFAYEDLVLDALEGEVMFDTNGNALTSTTLELVSDTDPSKDRAPIMGDVSMAFEIKYRPILTLPRKVTA